jgi:hypothetical protein
MVNAAFSFSGDARFADTSPQHDLHHHGQNLVPDSGGRTPPYAGGTVLAGGTVRYAPGCLPRSRCSAGLPAWSKARATTAASMVDSVAAGGGLHLCIPN